METKKELVNKLNEFKGKCNEDRLNIEQFNKQVEKYSRIKLPNIVNVYRDKVLELNDIFAEKGLEYFSSECYLRVLTNIYLNIYNYKLYKDLIDFAVNIKAYNFISNFSDKLAEKLYQNRVKEIREDMNYINNFNINEYPGVMELLLTNDVILSDLLPDCYETFFIEIINELKQLGVDYNKINYEDLMKKITYREYTSQNRLSLDPNKSIQKFEKFKNEYDIDIDSSYYNTLRLKK